jgi:hypothetical protein
MVEETHLAEQVKANLARVSLFAKFLMAPYCVETPIFNFYSNCIGSQPIHEQQYLVTKYDFPLSLYVPMV